MELIDHRPYAVDFMLDAWRPHDVEVLAFLASRHQAEVRLRFRGGDDPFHLHNVALALWVQQMGAVHQRWLHSDFSKRSLVTMLRFTVACRTPIRAREVVLTGEVLKTRPMKQGALNVCRFATGDGAFSGEGTFHYLPAEQAITLLASAA